MKIPNKVYDVLKWVLLIVVPAFEVCLNALAAAWAWNIPLEAITGTIAAVATFIGICLGISNYNYYKEDNNADS